MTTVSTLDKQNSTKSAEAASPVVKKQARTHRLWLGTTIALAGVTLVMLVVYLWLAVMWFNTPFVGATLSRTLTVTGGMPMGEERWAGLQAGLQRGDHLLALRYCLPSGADCIAADWSEDRNNINFARNAYDTFLAARQSGDEIQVTFNRPLNTALSIPDYCQPDTQLEGNLLCSVGYTLGRFPISDFTAFFGVPFISSIMILIVALIVLQLRHDQSTALLAVVGMLCLTIFSGGLFDLASTSLLKPIWLVTTTLLSGVLVTVGMVFPTSMQILDRRRWLIYAPITIAGLLAAVNLGFYLFPPTPQIEASSAPSASAVLLIGCIMFVYSLYQQRRKALTSTVRDQSNAVLIGAALMIAPGIAWLFTRVLQLIIPNSPVMLPFNIESVMPFTILPVLSVAYAVLQYRKFDTDRIISTGITYAIMLAALILGYFLLVLGASLLTAGAVRSTDPLLIALTIFAISVLFLPIRTGLQKRIDEVYFRKRRNFQELIEDFGQKLTSLVDLAHINREFRWLIDSTLAPSNIFIFLPDTESKEYIAYGEQKPETDVRILGTSPMIKLLNTTSEPVYLAPGRPWPDELRSERARLTILKSLIIAGLQGADQLNGFVSVGSPRSGKREYNFEELRFISSLTSQMAVAVERTQVIASLRRRVRELDVLSQVSQAVNFTIEFDALLELINAQTNKLIEATYFYIVMRDQVAEQLYFAFFVEDDERFKENEGKRWAFGRDLYSEVVTSGKPMRVDNFGQEAAKRSSAIQFMNEDVKAWMGVPLIAGPRTLGVMALATVEQNRAYTDDQLKIFNDIGALAATSLDKARLFAETEVRARQLSVLNDISQRLVASELNVEKLLEIITSSAVDILNAEAGSLFLLTEDNSGDLEFKVVVGGSGQELVGSRIPAGRGLVGEVAKKGKPAVVNDTRQDSRFQGDVAKNFRTSSILAVPLIAKNQVIGVLEVLNRKDGGVYSDSDTALLSTFAGQAAVAIENARLFEVTDLQLSKRIAELEALERIDVELNRTLDLKKVAEIAVRWAIAQTGASAGLIGLVTGEPPMLNVLALYGYTEEEYPDGAEGRLWPIDRGVVSRVMRTRQPDLVTDTSIDPDYEPSLAGAISQITIPMISGNQITALLVLESDRKDQRLSLLDQQFAQRLAEHASVAIENARLADELNRSLSSKSEFMRFAAHELKNPLTSIKGYAASLMNPMMFNAMNDQQKMDFLSVIHNNSQRMQIIIDDLRDAAAAEAKQLEVRPEPINFRNVVIETLRPFQKQLEDKAQELVNLVPDNLSLILGDQNRLIQVLTNLISNAHKYSPPESTITIGAEVVQNINNLLQEKYPNRRTKTRYNAPYLYGYVSDTGIGMTMEELGKLFREQYFRSDRPEAKEQPGTGLGMMITQSIIQLHQGEIWATSEMDVGTTFHFILPLAPQTEKTSQPEPASD